MQVEYSNILRAGPLTMMAERNRVTYHGRIVYLTNSETRLLRHLMHNANNIVSRQELQTAVYPNDCTGLGIIAVMIHSIRTKLGHEVIATRRGLGYLIEA
jgi:DNA-binding response OmpR family regulator